MPAPLGKTPTKKMPKIEVYGLEDSQATRGAIRFFRERRIVVQFVDLRKKPLTSDDLRRFIEALGMAALLEGGAGEAGEASAAREGDEVGDAPPAVGALLIRVRADPRVLRLPLVRHCKAMTSGKAEATWRSWLDRRPTR